MSLYCQSRGDALQVPGSVEHSRRYYKTAEIPRCAAYPNSGQPWYDHLVENEKVLQVTLTGEPVQPIRLYYQVPDKSLLIRHFRRLRCMDFDQQGNRWVWLYEYEGKTLGFEKPYASIPKQMHPIVIGSFFLKEDEAFLGLRSFDRAIKAIPFFHEHIGPDALRITHAAVVNRLFDAREQIPANLDVFFCSEEIVERHPDDDTSEDKSLAEVFADSERRAQQALPEVEKFPVHFYEDGISSVETTLRIRSVIAFEHWKGNVHYTFHDVLKTMIPGL